MKKVKTRIRMLRKLLGENQQTFAQRLGVSFVTVNRWERGKTQPSRLALEKIEQVEKTHEART